MKPEACEALPTETVLADSPEDTSEAFADGAAAPETSPEADTVVEPEPGDTSPQAPLPSDWMEEIDPKTGQVFYYNTSTQEVGCQLALH